MKLWGWWRKEPAQQPAAAEPVPDEPRYLEQKHEPRADAEATAALRQGAMPSVTETVRSLGPEDFKNVSNMPCFRPAILTGVGIGVVSGAIIYLTRKSGQRAMNWAMTGFVVGSTLSWEQCRFRRRQGKLNVTEARRVYANKDASASKETPQGN